MGDRRTAVREARSPSAATSPDRRKRRPSSTSPDPKLKSNVLLPSERLLEPGGALAELKTIRRSLESADKERDDTVNVQVARAYQIAYVYEHHPEAYLEFCRATKWKGGKPSPERPHDAIRFVIRQLVRQKDPKKKAKTVYLYVSALMELRERKVRPADVIATIEATKNGLNGLSAAAVARKRSRTDAASQQAGDESESGGGNPPTLKKPTISAESRRAAPSVLRVQLPSLTCLSAECYIRFKSNKGGYVCHSSTKWPIVSYVPSIISTEISY